jgi:hypothetical protein
MPIRRLAVALPVLASIGAMGCAPDDGVELLVDLRTDLLPACEVASVEVSVRASDRADPRAASEPIVGTANLVGGERVAEFRGLSLGPATIDAALRDAAGTLVAQRRTELELAGDTALTLFFTRDCVDVACPGAGDPANRTECLSGSCVDPSCHPGNPGGCGGVGCVDASSCPTPSACATMTCVSGACLGSPDDASCAPSESCHPTGGCSPSSSATGLRCPVGGDSDGDGLDVTVDCDDGDPMVGGSSERVCTSECAVGIERCTDGVWGDCDAPGDCTCGPGEVRDLSCERCGTQRQRCLDGTWIDEGACMDQGECATGTVSNDIEVHGFGRCDACVVGTVTCSAECVWEQDCPMCELGNFGASCAAESDCTGSTTCVLAFGDMGDPSKLGGICSFSCDESVSCPSDGVCLSFTGIVGALSGPFCSPICANAADCPTGWACTRDSEGDSRCSPICAVSTDCRPGQMCTSFSGVANICM